MRPEAAPSRPSGRSQRLTWLGLGCLWAVACGGPDRATDGRDHDRDAGSAGAPESERVEITDAVGRTLRLAAPPARVVSLVPSATATIRAIGAEDRLVGRTDFDRQRWISGLPSVGGGLEPNLEALVALEPDLVVRFAGDQDPRTPARLDDLGIPHLAVRPESVDGVLTTITTLGAALGRARAADSLAFAIRSELEEIQERVRPLPQARVIYVLGGTPPWVAGPGSYLDEILTLVGGVNVFTEIDGLYAPVSPEEIRARAPDVVLLSGPTDFDRSLTPDARIVTVDAEIEIPGPNLAGSARRLAEILHGPRFADP